MKRRGKGRRHTINVKSLSLSTKSCVLFWHPVETVGLLSARLLIMITWQLQLNNHYLPTSLYSLLSYYEKLVGIRLVVSHLALERTTSWIPDRQARKSRNPWPNCNESRFPGISRILFPAKIFCVFPNPARYFCHFPNLENAFPDLKLWWDYPSC